MEESTLRIGTRASRLATVQSRWVRDELGRLAPGRTIELVTIKTEGDRIVDRPLSQVPGKGFFVKEIQKALVDGAVDLAVHSLKDLPVEPTPGLTLGAIPPRESPLDVLITEDGVGLEALPEGALVGTSSARRRCQLANRRPDLRFVDLRGNVDTRLTKLSRGDCRALVLARAGLNRLGLFQVKAVDLPVLVILPAVGQGALAIEIRAGDRSTLELVGRLDDRATRIAVTAERVFLAELGGGCSTPIGALAQVHGDTVSFEGVVCDPQSNETLRGRIEGPVERADALARELARELISRGADRFLATR